MSAILKWGYGFPNILQCVLEFKFSTFSKFWMEIFEIGRLGADSFCGVIISSSYCGVNPSWLPAGRIDFLAGIAKMILVSRWADSTGLSSRTICRSTIIASGQVLQKHCRWKNVFFFINPRVFNWVRACCATATRVPKEHAKKWLQALRDRKAEKMQEHEKLRQMGLQQQIRRNQLLSNKRGISDVEGVSYFLLSYLVNYPSPYLLI